MEATRAVYQLHIYPLDKTLRQSLATPQQAGDAANPSDQMLRTQLEQISFSGYPRVACRQHPYDQETGCAPTDGKGCPGPAARLDTAVDRLIHLGRESFRAAFLYTRHRLNNSRLQIHDSLPWQR